jgi:hypothetical protein
MDFIAAEVSANVINATQFVCYIVPTIEVARFQFFPCMEVIKGQCARLIWVSGESKRRSAAGYN